MKSLDLMGIPLEGTHLMEASAGTGKTYTIASLFVRLLLEKELHVREILVVTYTKPATEELRTRVRERLRAALLAFETGESDDVFLGALLRSFERHDRAVQSLEFALRRFDEAAIFTIHGFCSRVLSDMAFESLSPFRVEMITDQSDLLKQTVADFYRRHFAGDMPPELLHYALGQKLTFSSFLDLPPKLSLDAEVIPGTGRPDLQLPLREYREAFRRLALAWPGIREDFFHLLETDPGLSHSIYRTASIPRMRDDMDGYLRSEGCSLPLFKDFVKFTSSNLVKPGTVKKGFTPPEHVVFDLCQRVYACAGELVQGMDRYLAGIKAELFSTLRTALPARKDELGVMYYDDLLLKVHQCLASENRDLLRGLAMERYRAALIDEFQDTDPIQYGIFSALFSGSPLFLIGDPKQAIYSFRGADVFTYLRAARGVPGEAKHTLDRNWRSEPGLIDAVNRVFHREEPFVFPEIAFEPVLPADVPDRKRLEDPEGAPLVVWFEPGREGGPLNRADANERVSRAVAGEVSRLLHAGLEGEARIGGRGIAPRDIALVVRTNREGRILRDALVGFGIPCVIYSDESVFDTDEAVEMEMLLRAVAQPNSADRVRTVLAGPLFGLDGRDIDGLCSDEAKLEVFMEEFRFLHELWLNHGFMRMFRRLLNGRGVRRRLLERFRGERSLTNFLHLAEILGEASLQGRLGMRGLIAWLSRRSDPLAHRDDKHQLRLESDDDAVKILTAHKSKGLEFPIVFCPFLWGTAALRDRKNVSFHDETQGFRAFLDVGSPELEEHAGLARKEALAEDMRLAYVALTRARNRCYLAWGRFNRAEGSALTRLLQLLPHRSRLEAGERPRVAGPDDDPLRVDLENLCAGSGGNILVQDMPARLPARYVPPGPGKTEVAFRRLSRSIDLSWRVASFTSLVSGAHASGEADRDALYFAPPAGPPEEGGEPDIFGFPKGARAGTAIHEIFENLDFTEGGEAIDEHVARALDGHGFDPLWRPAVSGMVGRVLEAGLGGFSLSDIGRQDTLRELEFYLPAGRLTPGALREAFELHPGGAVPATFPPALGELGFEESTGYIRGFIDLVFTREGRYYLLDWKSNHLGNAPGDYGEEAMGEAMEKNRYLLQAHIYALALHRYLGTRVKGYSYERHFGGVIYLFVRGVDSTKGPGCGICRFMPDRGLIEHLSGIACSRGGEEGG